MDEFQIIKDSGILDTFIYAPPQPEPPTEPIPDIELLGVLGFTLESLNYFGNSASTADSQRLIAGFCYNDLVTNEISEGAQLTYTHHSKTYTCKITRIIDMLDGWAEVYLDFVSRT